MIFVGGDNSPSTFLYMDEMKNHKIAIFDMDGTLTDSMWVWRKVDDDYCREYGVILNDEDRQNILAATYDGAVRYIMDKCGSTESVEDVSNRIKEMATYEYTHNVPLIRGAKEYLQYLTHKGIPIYLLTSCTEDMAMATLLANDIQRYFKGFFFATQPYQVKTRPDIYLESISSIDATPDQCVVFEDMPFALRTAKSLGAYCVGILGEHSLHTSDILAQYADIVVEDYHDKAVLELFS